MDRVGILGATGPVGAEAARLIVTHPELELAWASSREHASRPLATVHPHLAGATQLRFSKPEPVPELDALVCATPHGVTGSIAEDLLDPVGHVVDLSSDFRLIDPELYEETYGEEHPAPELLAEAAYGLPELSRQRLDTAGILAGPGCLATASILALSPLAEHGLVGEGPVVVDAKIGSTAAGNAGGRWSSHAVREATVRPYAPTGHRHEAEIQQAVDAVDELRFSAHAVDMPRGVLATVHVDTDADRKQLRAALLDAYNEEAFVDVLPGRAGPGGVPEPRFVAGTNRAQVAALPRENGGAVVLCAIDNLGKGAAGTGVQLVNARLGYPETLGLEARAPFP